MVSPENKHTATIIQTKQVIIKNMYVYAYAYVSMHVKTISKEKRGHEFRGEWEEVYGRFWREEMKGQNINYNLKMKKSVIGVWYRIPLITAHRMRVSMSPRQA